MEAQINGTTLSEVSPEAASLFKMAETLRNLGITALYQDLGKVFEHRNKFLQEAIRAAEAERDGLRADCERLTDELISVRAKLARPKAGRVSSKKSQSSSRRAIPSDVDATTQELMDEAYNGKSKSEMRRHTVMKEAKHGK